MIIKGILLRAENKLDYPKQFYLQTIFIFFLSGLIYKA